MEKNNVVIRKIPLEILIDMLVDAYNEGADYADLRITLDDKQDKVMVIIKDEYMNFDRESQETNDVSDDEINELLNQSLN